MNLKFWYSPKGVVIISLVSIVGFILLRDHRSHLVQAVPYMILLLCPLMHIFMHGQHGHGNKHGGHDGQDDEKLDAYRRGLEEGRKRSGSRNAGIDENP